MRRRKLLLLSSVAVIAGSSPETYQAEVRDTTLASLADATFGGDSVWAGNGYLNTPTDSATDFSIPSRYKARLTSGTTLRREKAGMAFKTPNAGANTGPIPYQILGGGDAAQTPGQTTPQLTNNDQFWNGMLNDYNPGVVPEPGAQACVANAVAGNVAIRAGLLGGASQLAIFLSNTAAGDEGPGMRFWASWVVLQRQLNALYPGQQFDLRRHLLSLCTTTPADLDYVNMANWWDIPLMFRGMTGSVNTFTNTSQTVFKTVSTTTNTAAGINAALPYASEVDGQLVQNTHINFATGSNVWRRSAEGPWVQIDWKHPSRYYSDAAALVLFDMRKAIQNQGAAVAHPAGLACAEDAAAGTALGTIYYTAGTAPVGIGLFDSAGVLVPQVTLVDNGVTNNRGTITATRSGSGVLVEGQRLFTLQTRDAAGKIRHSTVDLIVGEASTVTVPRLKTIPNSSGAITAASDFSMCGQEAHGLLDGDKFTIAGWFNPSDLTTVPYLFYGVGGHGDSSSLSVNISATGQLRVIATNSAGTSLISRSTNNAGGVFTQGTPSWFILELDTSGATVSISGYFNKLGGTGLDVAMTFSGSAAVGLTTIAASKLIPRFFALRQASYANQNYGSSPDTNRNQFRGDIGTLIVANGLVGIGTAATSRRLLWVEATSLPVARVSHSAINGITPVFDIRMSGLTFRGGHSLTEPVYGTYRAIKGMFP